MISFIVPAHNEEACLGRTLQAIHESARAVRQTYEIVVADDASTDATAEVAGLHQKIGQLTVDLDWPHKARRWRAPRHGSC